MRAPSSYAALVALFCALPAWASPSHYPLVRRGQDLPGVKNTTANASTVVDFKTRNFNTIAQIYDFAGFPQSTAFIKNGMSAIPAGLFSANATGRVSPVGNFSGAEESAEYFFGLSPQGEAPFNIGWTSVDIHSFQSECPEVAVSSIRGRTTVVKPGDPTDGDYVSTLEQTAFWRFDENGAVIQFDAILHNLGLWFEKAYKVDFTQQKVQIGAIQVLCDSIQSRCTGANQQYKSTEDCIVQMAMKPFGSYNAIWGDNVVCRTIHVILTQLRPEIHCPHVGPTGHMKCVDIDYNDYYFNDDQLYGGNDTFKCPEITAVSQQDGGS